MQCSLHHGSHIAVRQIPHKDRLALCALSVCPLLFPLYPVSSALSGAFCVPSSLSYTHHRFVLPRTCCDICAILCACDGSAPPPPHSQNRGGGGALAIARTNDAYLFPYPGEQFFSFFFFFVGYFVKGLFGLKKMAGRRD